MKGRAALVMTLLLSACGGAPTHFYTLAPVLPAILPETTPCAEPPVSVHTVLLPAVLDREAVVRARDTESLEISRNDRWAAPLDGMIQHVIAQDLRQRLPANRVLLPGDTPPSGGTDGLTLNFQQFVANMAGVVALQADWALTRPPGPVVLARSAAI